MIIKVQRSGGFTGIEISKEMDVEDLPSELIATTRKIMEDKEPSLKFQPPPKGAADHYNYKISIQDGVKQKVLECNQYNIQDDLKSLIRYIERNSK
jgi:hypothetical protein